MNLLPEIKRVYNGRLTGAETLYGSQIKQPTIFYKKDDPTPYKYPDDL